MTIQINSSAQRVALFCVFVLLNLSAACNRGTPQPASTIPPAAAKRYALKGKVISLDKQAGTASINNDPISGFMDPMVMPYTIQPPAALNQLQPGDSITADVVVAPDKYWLENVKITAHANPLASENEEQKKEEQKKEKQ
jgi:Cu/Ag efflux protein CusF